MPDDETVDTWIVKPSRDRRGRARKRLLLAGAFLLSAAFFFQMAKPLSFGHDSLKKRAPWLDSANCANKQRPYVFADGSIVPGSNGKQLRCRLVINVCGMSLTRQKIIEAGNGESCFDSKSISRPFICCSVWKSSIGSKDCDPLKDADCDGIPNDQDGDPLAPESNQPCRITAADVNHAFDHNFQRRGIQTPQDYVNVDADPGLLKFDLGLGRNFNVLPSLGWTYDQGLKGNIKPGAPEAPIYILLGSIQVICNEGIRVNIRIVDVATGAVLEAGSGTSTQINQSALDQSLNDALSKLKTQLR